MYILNFLFYVQFQGHNWLPNAGWAISNAAHRRWPAASSILPKTGWAIAHTAHTPVTPLITISRKSICVKVKLSIIYF